MPKKRFSAEQIVTLLRQIEVFMARGKSAPEACRDAEIPSSHAAHLFAHCNLVRLHKPLRIPPAMAANVTDRVWSLQELGEQTSI
jgi:hypothetical protein